MVKGPRPYLFGFRTNRLRFGFDVGSVPRCRLFGVFGFDVGTRRLHLSVDVIEPRFFLRHIRVGGLVVVGGLLRLGRGSPQGIFRDLCVCQAHPGFLSGTRPPGRGSRGRTRIAVVDAPGDGRLRGRRFASKTRKTCKRQQQQQPPFLQQQQTTTNGDLCRSPNTTKRHCHCPIDETPFVSDTR